MRRLYNLSQGHQINSDIIFDDGIWGKVGHNFDASDALAIGCTMGMMLKSKNKCLVVLGKDTRSSSNVLETELSRGLAASGCYVLQAGVVPLPVLLFSMHWMESSALMISGDSYNEDINGFTLFMEGQPVRGEKLRRLCALATNGTWKKDRGGALVGDILRAYKQYLRQRIKNRRPMKIAWDLGRATACTVIPELIEHIDSQHILYNEVIDTKKAEIAPDAFDPERVALMQQRVREQRCDIGLIINVNATQIAVIDDTGKLCDVDAIFLILLTHLHAQNPALSVMINPGTRMWVNAVIKKNGVSVLHAPQSFGGMLQQMIQQKGHLGTDGQGRYAFQNHMNSASFDAIYAAIELINALSTKSISLSQHVTTMVRPSELRHYSFSYSPLEALIQQVRTRLLKKNIRTLDIDGLRNDYSNGWWWIRPRQTLLSPDQVTTSHTEMITALPREEPPFRGSTIEITIEANRPAAMNALNKEIASVMPEWKQEPNTSAQNVDTLQEIMERPSLQALEDISEEERYNIEFSSRHWRSLRTPGKIKDNDDLS